jgi:hypothetical protein
MMAELRSKRVLDLAFLVGLLGIVAVTWYGNSYRQSRTNERDAMVHSLTFQHLFAGVRLPLDSLTKPLVPPAGSAAAHLANLLLVVSDACPFSQQDIPLWHELLGQIGGDVHVWILTKGGDVVAKQLSGWSTTRGLTATIVESSNPRQFALVTGIRGTPVTVLLDRDMSTQMVAWRMSALAVPMLVAEANRLTTKVDDRVITR